MGSILDSVPQETKTQHAWAISKMGVAAYENQTTLINVDIIKPDLKMLDKAKLQEINDLLNENLPRILGTKKYEMHVRSNGFFELSETNTGDYVGRYNTRR